MERLESGLENGDNAMVAVGIGGAVVGAGLTKIAPKRVKRVKSYTRKYIERAGKKFPRCFQFAAIMVAAVNLLLYWFDLITDAIVTWTFYQHEHFGWFTISLGMMGVQYLVAMVGIAYYCWKENPFGIDWDRGFDTCKKVLLFTTLPLTLTVRSNTNVE